VPHELFLHVYATRSGGRTYLKEVTTPLQLAPNQRVTLFADVSQGLNAVRVVTSANQ